jgi:segregation and condensation protein B
MEPKELRGAMEAILFVATEPVKLEELVEAFPDEGSDAIVALLEEIRRTLQDHVAGFVLEQTAGGYRLATGPEHDPTLRRFFAKKGEGRLSLAALETLAIIAYRQPVTAPEISDIRGVNTTGVIRTLLERKMIRVAGRKNVVGSPFLYRTTRDFLVHFGLNDIQDLPRLEEFADLIGENIVDDLAALPTQVGMFDDGGVDPAAQQPTSSESEAVEDAKNEQEVQGERSSRDHRTGEDEKTSERLSAFAAGETRATSESESRAAAAGAPDEGASPVRAGDDVEASAGHEEMYEDREGTVESDPIDEQHD